MFTRLTTAKNYVVDHAEAFVIGGLTVAVVAVSVYQSKQTLLHVTKKAAKHLAKEPGNVVYYTAKGHIYELMEVHLPK